MFLVFIIVQQHIEDIQQAHYDTSRV